MRLDAEAVRDITRGTELITECDEKIAVLPLHTGAGGNVQKVQV